MKTFSHFLAAAVLASLLATTAAEARTRVYVRVGPPPIIVERVVAAPAPGYVWQPGYYRWNGDAYAWTGGTWVQPPRPHARWVPGHWRHNRHGHYWVEGHWTR